MNIVVGGIILLILCLLFAAGAAYLVYQADLSVYEKDFSQRQAEEAAEAAAAEVTGCCAKHSTLG